MSEGESAAPSFERKWKPIGRVERRVLGVLVEKAKTTPDAYPLTLNSLTNGCNQKSNRDPQMTLDTDQVELALEKLRHVSAVIEVTGGGRVAKFRHLAYDWLGVDKIEAAVITELLLRGAQTVGELRGRAARMEPIADVATLQPVVQSLAQKGLVVTLSPSGRGQLVTHALFLPEEMDKVRANASQITATAAHSTPAPPHRRVGPPPAPAATAPEASSSGDSDDLQRLRSEVEELKEEVARLKSDIQDLWSNIS